jgi:hypothetical protein
MEPTIEELLEGIKADLKRQDEEWRRAREALLALGDARIAVPTEVLDQLEAPATAPVRPVTGGVRA